VECLTGVEAAIDSDAITDRDALSMKLEQFAPETRLLMLKPTLIVLNVGEPDNASEGREHAMREWAASRGTPVVIINAEIESELAELEHEEAAEFEEAMGIEEESLARVVRASYRMLGLITFFSIDSGECRAWSVPAGSSASHAAGRIHTDFERGFVKAEVVHQSDFLECGCFTAAREAGSLRVEGRDYIVQDGDVMHFKFAT